MTHAMTSSSWWIMGVALWTISGVSIPVYFAQVAPLTIFAREQSGIRITGFILGFSILGGCFFIVTSFLIIGAFNAIFGR